MKKFLTLLASTAVLLVYTTSCNKENVGKETEANDPQLERSVIAQRAKELGKQLATKDVTLQDATGANKVVMRFAAPEREALDNYLATHEYSIVAVMSKSELGQGLKMVQTGVEKSSKPNHSGATGFVMTEEVSHALQSGAIGYKVRVKVKLITDPGARPMYANVVEHASPAWPEYGYIECLNYQIEAVLGKKNRWYSSWYDVAGVLLTAGNYWSPGVDGPYKARFVVYFDSGGDYSYFWIGD